MKRYYVLAISVLGLCLLLLGCNGETIPQLPPESDFDQLPLSQAQPFFNAGYELVGYYEIDANKDDVAEILAVLTIKTLPTAATFDSSAVLLFGQIESTWVRADDWQLDGVNADAKLHDLTGDGIPELVIVTQKANRQLGDFITPLHYSDHLTVFTYTPGLRLVELGTFSSSLVGETRPKSTIEKWNEGLGIQTFQDLPPTGNLLSRPLRVETFAWDGQEFTSMRVEERRRISPVVSWVVGRNAPWAAVSLAFGGTLSLVMIILTHRLRLQERWIILTAVLLLVMGGIILGVTVEWLCVPGLIILGLVGLEVGRRTTARLINEPNQDSETNGGE